MALSLRAAWKIKIHCPITPETLRALLVGNLAAVESDPAASRILAIIRADNPLGDFGLYRGVFEVSFGLEGFTPTALARPAEGSPGADTLSSTAVITTYADGDADRNSVMAAVDALVRAHPWEIPVIEVCEQGVQLAQRSD